MTTLEEVSLQPISDQPGQEAAPEAAPDAARVTRRRVLFAGAGTAAGFAVLAACGGTGGSSSESAGGSGGSAGSGGSGGGGGALVKASAVPVGSGVSAKDAQGNPVIVSQPSKGKIVAFSAVCTHMGCTVAPEGKKLVCPCHGSVYDIATGDNVSGPAPKPLPEIPVKVKGGEVVQT